MRPLDTPEDLEEAEEVELRADRAAWAGESEDEVVRAWLRAEEGVFSRGMRGRGRSTMEPAASEDQERRNLRVGQELKTSNWLAMACEKGGKIEVQFGNL